VSGPRLPRVLAVSPPRPGPWLEELPLLADAGVDGLLVRIFDDTSATELAARRARDCLPVVLLRWLGPASVDLAAALGLGLHLPAHRPPLRLRPLTSTSCHDLARLRAAAAAGLPLATLSPVYSPGSKPDDTRPPLGLAPLRTLPPGIRVLALGGMDPDRARAAVQAGAGGIAGIGAFFRSGHAHPPSARAVVDAVEQALSPPEPPARPLG
jgi:thiamine monophosphate synthase